MKYQVLYNGTGNGQYVIGNSPIGMYFLTTMLCIMSIMIPLITYFFMYYQRKLYLKSVADDEKN